MFSFGKSSSGRSRAGSEVSSQSKSERRKSRDYRDDDNDNESVTSSRRRSRPTSTTSTPSKRKSTLRDEVSRDDDDSGRNVGFTPQSTSFSSTSRSPYAGVAAPSVASSYATARPDIAASRYQPPELVRNDSMADRTRRDRDDVDNRRFGREEDRSRQRNGSSVEQRRSTIGRYDDGDDAEKRSQPTRRTTYDDNSSRKSTARSDPDRDTPRRRDSKRAEKKERDSNSANDRALDSHDAALPQNQFFSDPATYTGPYRPPGHAAEYYGDHGESVQYQPGVRPQGPSYVVNQEYAHLQTPSTEAKPPPEPSSQGQLGAAASFYAANSSADEAAGQPSSSSTRPPRPTQSTSSGRPPRLSNADLSGGSARTSPAPNGRIPFSAAGLAGATALGAGAGLAASYFNNTPDASSNRPPHTPQQTQQTGPGPSYSGSVNYGQAQNGNANASYPPRPSNYGDPPVTPGYSNSGPDVRPSEPANHYGAAAATAAGLAAAGGAAYLAHHHHQQDSQHQNSNDNAFSTGAGQYATRPDQPFVLGQNQSAFPAMKQQQRRKRRGVMGRLSDWWRDPNGVAQFEEYTEYIGVCRYCFDPQSNPGDAPRKHHYHGRNWRPPPGYLGRKSSSSLRVDKTYRQQHYSSDEEKRQRSSTMKKVAGATLGAVGAAKLGETLYRSKHDFDDTYSVKSGRPPQLSRHSSSEDMRLGRKSSSHRQDGSRRYADQISSRKSRRRTSNSSDEGLSRGAALSVGAGAAALGIAAEAAHRRRSRSRSRSNDRKSSRQKPYYSKRVSPRHSYVDLSRTKSNNVGFGSFFSSPSANQKSGKKSKGLFTFRNDSSSSSDADLAFGEGTVLRRRDSEKLVGRDRRNSRLKRKDSSGDVNGGTAAIMGLAAAGAALAAESDRSSRGKGKSRRNDADRDRKSRYEQESDRRSQRIALEDHTTDGEDDNAWEDATDDDEDKTSVDMGLAYGGRASAAQSRESLASDQGTSKWNWRWNKNKLQREEKVKKRRQSMENLAADTAVAAAPVDQPYFSYPQPAPDSPFARKTSANYTPFVAGVMGAGLGAAATAAALESQYSPSPMTVPPMRHVDPVPVYPSPQPENFASASQVDLQQPQPVPPPETQVERISKIESKADTADVLTEDRLELEREHRSRDEFDTRRSRLSQSREDSPDVPLVNPSTMSKNSVSFDLTEEQLASVRRAEEKEEKRRRRRERQEKRRTIDGSEVTQRLWEQEDHHKDGVEMTGRRRSSSVDDPAPKQRTPSDIEQELATLQAELKRERREKRKRQAEAENARDSDPSSKINDRKITNGITAAAVATGVGAATVALLEDRNKEATPRDERARGRQSDSKRASVEKDLPNAEGVSKAEPESQQQRIARMAAQRVRSKSPVNHDYEEYSKFFVPDDIAEHVEEHNKASKKRNQSPTSARHRDDLGANVVEVVPGAPGPSPKRRDQPFDEENYEPFGLGDDHDPLRYPWRVPRLSLVEPTPPGSVGHHDELATRSPLSPLRNHEEADKLADDVDEEEQPDLGEPLERKISAGSKVTFGEHDTWVYEVMTPEYEGPNPAESYEPLDKVTTLPDDVDEDEYIKENENTSSPDPESYYTSAAPSVTKALDQGAVVDAKPEEFYRPRAERLFTLDDNDDQAEEAFLHKNDNAQRPQRERSASPLRTGALPPSSGQPPLVYVDQYEPSPEPTPLEERDQNDMLGGSGIYQGPFVETVSDIDLSRSQPSTASGFVESLPDSPVEEKPHVEVEKQVTEMNFRDLPDATSSPTENGARPSRSERRRLERAMSSSEDVKPTISPTNETEIRHVPGAFESIPEDEPPQPESVPLPRSEVSTDPPRRDDGVDPDTKAVKNAMKVAAAAAAAASLGKGLNRTSESPAPSQIKKEEFDDPLADFRDLSNPGSIEMPSPTSSRIRRQNGRTYGSDPEDWEKAIPQYRSQKAKSEVGRGSNSKDKMATGTKAAGVAAATAAVASMLARRSSESTRNVRDVSKSRKPQDTKTSANTEKDTTEESLESPVVYTAEPDVYADDGPLAKAMQQAEPDFYAGENAQAKKRKSKQGSEILNDYDGRSVISSPTTKEEDAKTKRRSKRGSENREDLDTKSVASLPALMDDGRRLTSKSSKNDGEDSDDRDDDGRSTTSMPAGKEKRRSSSKRSSGASAKDDSDARSGKSALSRSGSKSDRKTSRDSKGGFFSSLFSTSKSDLSTTSKKSTKSSKSEPSVPRRDSERDRTASTESKQRRKRSSRTRSGTDIDALDVTSRGKDELNDDDGNVGDDNGQPPSASTDDGFVSAEDAQQSFLAERPDMPRQQAPPTDITTSVDMSTGSDGVSGPKSKEKAAQTLKSGEGSTAPGNVSDEGDETERELSLSRKTGTSVGRTADLVIPTPDRPRALSTTNIADVGSSAAHSPTAVPLTFFKKGPFTPRASRDTASSPVHSPHSPLTPRARQVRPKSTEFNSREVRPLYLIERHTPHKDAESEPEPEMLPALPASRTTSAHPSTENLRELLDEQVFEDGDAPVTVSDGARRHSWQSGDGEEVSRRLSAAYLDSRSATPVPNENQRSHQNQVEPEAHHRAQVDMAQRIRDHRERLEAQKHLFHSPSELLQDPQSFRTLPSDEPGEVPVEPHEGSPLPSVVSTSTDHEDSFLSAESRPATPEIDRTASRTPSPFRRKVSDNISARTTALFGGAAAAAAAGVGLGLAITRSRSRSRSSVRTIEEVGNERDATPPLGKNIDISKHPQDRIAEEKQPSIEFTEPTPIEGKGGRFGETLEHNGEDESYMSGALPSLAVDDEQTATELQERQEGSSPRSSIDRTGPPMHAHHSTPAAVNEEAIETARELEQRAISPSLQPAETGDLLRVDTQTEPDPRKPVDEGSSQPANYPFVKSTQQLDVSSSPSGDMPEQDFATYIPADEELHHPDSKLGAFQLGFERAIRARGQPDGVTREDALQYFLPRRDNAPFMPKGDLTPIEQSPGSSHVDSPRESRDQVSTPLQLLQGKKSKKDKKKVKKGASGLRQSCSSEGETPRSSNEQLQADGETQNVIKEPSQSEIFAPAALDAALQELAETSGDGQESQPSGVDRSGEADQPSEPRARGLDETQLATILHAPDISGADYAIRDSEVITPSEEQERKAKLENESERDLKERADASNYTQDVDVAQKDPLLVGALETAQGERNLNTVNGERDETIGIDTDVVEHPVEARADEITLEAVEDSRPASIGDSLMGDNREIGDTSSQIRGNEAREATPRSEFNQIVEEAPPAQMASSKKGKKNKKGKRGSQAFNVDWTEDVVPAAAAVAIGEVADDATISLNEKDDSKEPETRTMPNEITTAQKSFGYAAVDETESTSLRASEEADLSLVDAMPWDFGLNAKQRKRKEKELRESGAWEERITQARIDAAVEESNKRTSVSHDQNDSNTTLSADLSVKGNATGDAEEQQHILPPPVDEHVSEDPQEDLAAWDHGLSSKEARKKKKEMMRLGTWDSRVTQEMVDSRMAKKPEQDLAMEETETVKDQPVSIVQPDMPEAIEPGQEENTASISTSVKAANEPADQANDNTEQPGVDLPSDQLPWDHGLSKKERKKREKEMRASGTWDYRITQDMIDAGASVPTETEPVIAENEIDKDGLVNDNANDPTYTFAEDEFVATAKKGKKDKTKKKSLASQSSGVSRSEADAEISTMPESPEDDYSRPSELVQANVSQGLRNEESSEPWKTAAFTETDKPADSLSESLMRAEPSEELPEDLGGNDKSVTEHAALSEVEDESAAPMKKADKEKKKKRGSTSHDDNKGIEGAETTTLDGVEPIQQVAETDIGDEIPSTESATLPEAEEESFAFSKRSKKDKRRKSTGRSISETDTVSSDMKDPLSSVAAGVAAGGVVAMLAHDTTSEPKEIHAPAQKLESKIVNEEAAANLGHDHQIPTTHDELGDRGQPTQSDLIGEAHDKVVAKERVEQGNELSSKRQDGTDLAVDHDLREGQQHQGHIETVKEGASELSPTQMPLGLLDDHHSLKEGRERSTDGLPEQSPALEQEPRTSPEKQPITEDQSSSLTVDRDPATETPVAEPVTKPADDDLPSSAPKVADWAEVESGEQGRNAMLDETVEDLFDDGPKAKDDDMSWVKGNKKGKKKKNKRASSMSSTPSEPSTPAAENEHVLPEITDLTEPKTRLSGPSDISRKEILEEPSSIEVTDTQASNETAMSPGQASSLATPYERSIDPFDELVQDEDATEKPNEKLAVEDEDAIAETPSETPGETPFETEAEGGEFSWATSKPKEKKSKKKKRKSVVWADEPSAPGTPANELELIIPPSPERPDFEATATEPAQSRDRSEAETEAERKGDRSSLDAELVIPNPVDEATEAKGDPIAKDAELNRHDRSLTATAPTTNYDSIEAGDEWDTPQRKSKENKKKTRESQTAPDISSEESEQRHNLYSEDNSLGNEPLETSGAKTEETGEDEWANTVTDKKSKKEKKKNKKKSSISSTDDGSSFNADEELSKQLETEPDGRPIITAVAKEQDELIPPPDLQAQSQSDTIVGANFDAKGDQGEKIQLLGLENVDEAGKFERLPSEAVTERDEPHAEHVSDDFNQSEWSTPGTSNKKEKKKKRSSKSFNAPYFTDEPLMTPRELDSGPGEHLKTKLANQDTETGPEQTSGQSDSAGNELQSTSVPEPSFTTPAEIVETNDTTSLIPDKESKHGEEHDAQPIVDETPEAKTTPEEAVSLELKVTAVDETPKEDVVMASVPESQESTPSANQVDGDDPEAFYRGLMAAQDSSSANREMSLTSITQPEIQDTQDAGRAARDLLATVPPNQELDEAEDFYRAAKRTDTTLSTKSIEPDLNLERVVDGEAHDPVARTTEVTETHVEPKPQPEGKADISFDTEKVLEDTQTPPDTSGATNTHTQELTTAESNPSTEDWGVASKQSKRDKKKRRRSTTDSSAIQSSTNIGLESMSRESDNDEKATQIATSADGTQSFLDTATFAPLEAMATEEKPDPFDGFSTKASKKDKKKKKRQSMAGAFTDDSSPATPAGEMDVEDASNIVPSFVQTEREVDSKWSKPTTPEAAAAQFFNGEADDTHQPMQVDQIQGEDSVAEPSVKEVAKELDATPSAEPASEAFLDDELAIPTKRSKKDKKKKARQSMVDSSISMGSSLGALVTEPKVEPETSPGLDILKSTPRDTNEPPRSSFDMPQDEDIQNGVPTSANELLPHQQHKADDLILKQSNENAEALTMGEPNVTSMPSQREDMLAEAFPAETPVEVGNPPAEVADNEWSVRPKKSKKDKKRNKSSQVVVDEDSAASRPPEGMLHESTAVVLPPVLEREVTADPEEYDAQTKAEIFPVPEDATIIEKPSRDMIVDAKGIDEATIPSSLPLEQAELSDARHEKIAENRIEDLEMVHDDVTAPAPEFDFVAPQADEEVTLQGSSAREVHDTTATESLQEKGELPQAAGDDGWVFSTKKLSKKDKKRMHKSDTSLSTENFETKNSAQDPAHSASIETRRDEPLMDEESLLERSAERQLPAESLATTTTAEPDTNLDKFESQADEEWSAPSKKSKQDKKRRKRQSQTDDSYSRTLDPVDDLGENLNAPVERPPNTDTVGSDMVIDNKSDALSPRVVKSANAPPLQENEDRLETLPEMRRDAMEPTNDVIIESQLPPLELTSHSSPPKSTILEDDTPVAPQVPRSEAAARDNQVASVETAKAQNVSDVDAGVLTGAVAVGAAYGLSQADDYDDESARAAIQSEGSAELSKRKDKKKKRKSTMASQNVSKDMEEESAREVLPDARELHEDPAHQGFLAELHQKVPDFPSAPKDLEEESAKEVLPGARELHEDPAHQGFLAEIHQKVPDFPSVPSAETDRKILPPLQSESGLDDGLGPRDITMTDTLMSPLQELEQPEANFILSSSKSKKKDNKKKRNQQQLGESTIPGVEEEVTDPASQKDEVGFDSAGVGRGLAPTSASVSQKPSITDEMITESPVESSELDRPAIQGQSRECGLSSMEADSPTADLANLTGTTSTVPEDNPESFYREFLAPTKPVNLDKPNNEDDSWASRRQVLEETGSKDVEGDERAPVRKSKKKDRKERKNTKGLEEDTVRGFEGDFPLEIARVENTEGRADSESIVRHAHGEDDSDGSNVSESTKARRRRKGRSSSPTWHGQEPDDLPRSLQNRALTPPPDHDDIMDTALGIAAGLGIGAEQDRSAERELFKHDGARQRSKSSQSTAWNINREGKPQEALRDSAVEMESEEAQRTTRDSGYVASPQIGVQRIQQHEGLRPPRPRSPTSSSEDVHHRQSRMSKGVEVNQTPARRQPSPIESTSKERSSVVFKSSPAVPSPKTPYDQVYAEIIPMPGSHNRSPSLRSQHGNSLDNLRAASASPQQTRSPRTSGDLTSNLLDRVHTAEVEHREVFSPSPRPDVERAFSPKTPLQTIDENGLALGAVAAGLVGGAAMMARDSSDSTRRRSLGKSKSRTSSLRQLRATTSSPFEPNPELNPPQQAPSTSDAADERGRSATMADVYDGYGAAPGSPRSPTRPPSIKKRQSLQQISDLQLRVEQLASENRQLAEQKLLAERHIEDLHLEHNKNDYATEEALKSVNVQLRQRDEEITKLKTEIEELLQARDAARSEHDQKYTLLLNAKDQAHAQYHEATRDLDTLRQQHTELSGGMEGIMQTQIDAALAAKNDECDKLRQQLDQARAKIRELQQQILARGIDEVVVVRNEDYFDDACQQLCHHVQQWVLRFSKFSDTRVCRRTDEVEDEKVVDRFDNAILDGSDVDFYLADRVKRRDIFMSVVMTMIWEHVFTRYLFGMDRDQRQKLKNLEKTLAEVGPAGAVHQWRALTLTLLAKRPAFKTQKELDTEAVADEVLRNLSEFLPPPKNLRAQIFESLKNVMRAAAKLSIEMRTQKAEYIMLPPLQPEYNTNGDLAHKVYFKASLMNERSGETTSNEELEQSKAVVRTVLFPLVVKKGDDDGSGVEEIVVCPAQVLVAKSDKGKRPKSRAASGGSERERAQSRMSMNMSAAAASTHSLGGMSGVEGNVI